MNGDQEVKIVIVGGGKVAAHLVSLLTAEFEHKITIIEMRRETSMYLVQTVWIFVSSTVMVKQISYLEVAAVDQADLLAV